MAVYHFTVHAYRSWRPDHPRGNVHHTDGPLPPDSLMANDHDALAKFGRVPFDDVIRPMLLREAHDICRNRGCRLHAAGTDPMHVHLLVSWRRFTLCSDVLNKLKNVLSYQLGRQVGPIGRRWFVRGGSMRRVSSRSHFDHLIGTYIPSHLGVCWREGLPLP